MHTAVCSRFTQTCSRSHFCDSKDQMVFRTQCICDKPRTVASQSTEKPPWESQTALSRSLRPETFLPEASWHSLGRRASEDSVAGKTPGQETVLSSIKNKGGTWPPGRLLVFIFVFWLLFPVLHPFDSVSDYQELTIMNPP